MKKGISAVVATVLIILITVAAVTIIWAAVIPMIKNNLTGSDECMKAQSEVSIGASGYTCKTSDGMHIRLQVVHGPSPFKLSSLQVIIHDSDGNTQETSISSGLPTSNQEKVFDISENYDAYSSATKIDIAPVLAVGSTTKNCGIAQSYDLVTCATA